MGGKKQGAALGRHRELLGKLHRNEMVEENETKKEDCYTATHSALCKMRNLTLVLLFTLRTNFIHSFIHSIGTCRM